MIPMKQLYTFYVLMYYAAVVYNYRKVIRPYVSDVINMLKLSNLLSNQFAWSMLSDVM